MAKLSKDQVKKIIDGRPEGTEPQAIIEGLLQRGYELEGLNVELPKPPKEDGAIMKTAKGIGRGLEKTGQAIGDVTGIGGVSKAVGGAVGTLIQPMVGNKVNEAVDETTELIKKAKMFPVGSEGRKLLMAQALKLSGDASILAESSLKGLEESPNAYQALGSTGKVALNAATLGGAGLGSNLSIEVLKNAALGAGFGFSEQVEEGKTIKESLTGAAIGAGVGASIPIATEILSLGAERALPKIAQVLERVNLRLTPTQKITLRDKLDDVTSYLSNQKIVGSPEARFNKINTIYNQKEEVLQEFLKKDLKDRTIAKETVIKQLNNVKRQFTNERDVIAMNKQIDSLIETIQTRYPNNIPAWKLNYLKRSTYENAFNRAGDKVLDDVEFAMGDKLGSMVELIAKGGKSGEVRKIAGKTLDEFNKEYGTIITARKLLRIAAGRNQLGVFGKFLSTIMGGAIGSTGGPIGAGVGAIVGEKVGEAAFGTPTRSFVGSTLKNISEAPVRETMQTVRKVGTSLIGR